MGGLVTRHQHTAYHDIYVWQLFPDVMLRRVQRMHIGWGLDIQLAQSWQRDVCDGYFCAQSGSHQGCGLANDTTTQHQYAGRTYTRHTTNQFSLASLGFLQIVGSVQGSHSSCHLTHGLQQGQRSVRQLYRLVGQTDGSTLQHGFCQFFLAGEMEIGKNQLSLSHQLVFWLNGLLHLHNHVAFPVHIVYSGQNTCTSFHVFFIREARTLAGSMLYTYLMTSSRQLCHSCRGHTYAVLVVLNLFGDSYFHKSFGFC